MFAAGVVVSLVFAFGFYFVLWHMSQHEGEIGVSSDDLWPTILLMVIIVVGPFILVIGWILGAQFWRSTQSYWKKIAGLLYNLIFLVLGFILLEVAFTAAIALGLKFLPPIIGRGGYGPELIGIGAICILTLGILKPKYRTGGHQFSRFFLIVGLLGLGLSVLPQSSKLLMDGFNSVLKLANSPAWSVPFSTKSSELVLIQYYMSRAWIVSAVSATIAILAWLKD
jgi:hypothetical protein